VVDTCGLETDKGEPIVGDPVVVAPVAPLKTERAWTGTADGPDS
jgi:hypothetical protein